MRTRTMEKEINERTQRPVFKYVVEWLLFKKHVSPSIGHCEVRSNLFQLI